MRYPQRFILALALVVPGTLFAKGVTVKDGWVRLLPGGGSRTSIYMTIANPDKKAVSLNKVEGAWAGSFELHSSKEINGMVMMEPVAKLEIPGEGEVVLKPGSFHIMVQDIKKPLKEGESLPLTLILSTGEKTEITLPVKSLEAESRM